MSVELRKTIKVLNQFGAYAVESAQLELGTTRKIRGRKVRRVATGGLKNSLYHRVKVRTNTKGADNFTVLFGSTKDYAKFIHEGVNGTKVKLGAPYTFKSKFVNMGAVRKWIDNKPIRLRKPGGGFIAKNEKNINRAVYAISKSIAEKGIVGLPFMDLGIKRALRKYDKLIADAVIEDTINNVEWL